MRLPVRIALVVLGLAAAVYGTASLTGRWLGPPPWWERAAPMDPFDWVARYHADWIFGLGPRLLKPADDATEVEVVQREPVDLASVERRVRLEPARLPWKEAQVRAALHVGPRAGREWVSGGVVAAGFALAAFGAWPRRRTGRRS